MKPIQKFKYAIGTVVSCWLVACAVDPIQEMDVLKAEDPDYEKIRSIGFTAEGIIELEDFYIVEGDIMIDKDSIDCYLPKTRQARHNLIADGCENGIRVKITSATVQEPNCARQLFRQ